MRPALENTEDMLSNPARFAEAIRALSRDAHRLRHSPSAAALWGLVRRIEVLESVHGELQGGPVGTWLHNLGREVRSAAAHRAGSTRPMCICPKRTHYGHLVERRTAQYC
jgi:hypothetical protein